MENTLPAAAAHTRPLLSRLAREYRSTLARHPLVGVLLLGFGAYSALDSPPDGVSRWQQLAYPLTMLVCALVFDALWLRRRDPAGPVEVRSPARESALVLLPFFLGLAWLTWKFAFPTHLATLAFLIRPPCLSLVFLLLLPVVPVAALLVRGYRWRGFALPPRGVWIAPVLIALIAGATYLASPSFLAGQLAHFRKLNVFAFLALGFGQAAIPEEVFRFLAQSRLGALFRNRAAGWVLASYLWSFGHLPAHMPETFHTWSGFLAGTLGALHLMPIGLLWGYLTHRSGSLWPSVLIHGTNVWGLHNL